MFKSQTRYKIKTPLGYENFKGIQKKIVKDLYIFTFEDKTILKCSGKHALLTSNGFEFAKDIADKFDQTFESNITGKRVISISRKIGEFEVYDPVGIDSKSYYSHGIVSHNTEFIGSTNTLISPHHLIRMDALKQKPIYIEDDVFRVFEHPIPKHQYVITCDVSEGQNRDYSTFSVIDVTSIPYKQVACYQDNKVKAIVFPSIIYAVAVKYNEAYILIEINGIGTQVADLLHYDLAYERLLKVETKNKQGQHISGGFKKKLQFGLKQSSTTKRIGCTNIKALIESEKLIVPDRLTIQEFKSFSENKDSFAAEEGKHDDLVMSLVLFGWLALEKYFREAIQSNVRPILQEEDLELNDFDLLPLPIIDDHTQSTNSFVQGGEVWDVVSEKEWEPMIRNNYTYEKPLGFPGMDNYNPRL